jgi:hypothetical protein
MWQTPVNAKRLDCARFTAAFAHQGDFILPKQARFESSAIQVETGWLLWSRHRRGGFFLLAAQLVFELGHAIVEALQNFPRFGRDGHAVLAMVARGGAAFDGIIKLLAAGAAGARALTGGGGCGHGKFNRHRVLPLFGNDAVGADGK